MPVSRPWPGRRPPVDRPWKSWSGRRGRVAVAEHDDGSVSGSRPAAAACARNSAMSGPARRVIRQPDPRRPRRRRAGLDSAATSSTSRNGMCRGRRRSYAPLMSAPALPYLAKRSSSCRSWMGVRWPTAAAHRIRAHQGRQAPLREPRPPSRSRVERLPLGIAGLPEPRHAELDAAGQCGDVGNCFIG